VASSLPPAEIPADFLEGTNPEEAEEYFNMSGQVIKTQLAKLNQLRSELQSRQMKLSLQKEMLK